MLSILTLSSTFGQSSSRTYFAHGHNYGSTYTYGITEITIQADSTYTRQDWSFHNKKNGKPITYMSLKLVAEKLREMASIIF